MSNKPIGKGSYFEAIFSGVFLKIEKIDENGLCHLIMLGPQEIISDAKLPLKELIANHTQISAKDPRMLEAKRVLVERLRLASEF